MSDSGLVLVDTSVWIQFFRHAPSAEAKILDEVLAAGSVATCAPIRAEVISGAPTKHEFQRLRKLFGALTVLEPPTEVWNHIAEHRFHLARNGMQVSLVDLWIAVTADFHHVSLWTLDKDFTSIKTAIPVRLY